MRISDWSSDVCSSDLRGLAELDGAHVVLHDADLLPAPLSAVVQQVGEGAPVGHDPRAARRRGAVDGAVGRQDAGQVHLRQNFDDAGAADAGDALLTRLRGDTGLVRPQLAADHLEARLPGPRVYAHALDGD